MKRFATLLLALVMILSLATTAFAQTVDSAKDGAATITIQNASKGETYSVYKLFDATVTGTEGGSIAYTGEIPADLTAYFSKDTAGNISLAADVDETALFDALKAWAASATAAKSAESDGSVMTFTNLQYGYYVVTSTQNNGAAITVTSTNPDATIVDKNTTTPIEEPKKEANGESYNIGDTITYTVSFGTATYDGTEQIISYTIKDTLPDFLGNVAVTEITVGGTAIAIQQFDANGEITIPWVKEGTNLYANGAELKITYTAVLTDKATVDGNGNNNTVTISYETDKDGGGSEETTSEIIYTYAAALKKVDENGNALAGAQFTVKGLTVTGEAGNYTVVSYDANSETESAVLDTDADGKLIIKGLAEAASLTVTEYKAPDGYNKLTAPVTLTPQKIGEAVTATTKYYDENGDVTETKTENVVVEFNDKLEDTALQIVNKAGTELPSTGGMGTTLFYVIGGMMMLAAVVLLVTKKRMAAAE